MREAPRSPRMGRRCRPAPPRTRLDARAAALLVARAAALLVCSLAWLPAPGFAQVSLRNEVDTTLVTVGDRITLTVRVTHPPDASVSWPDSLDLAPFEVLGAGVLPVERTDAALVSSAAFELAAFELGELEVPSFPISVVLGDGSLLDVETDRFGIEVVSVGQDEGGDIREIRGPLMIPIDILTLGGWLIALLVTLLGGAWAYRRWARSRESGEPVEVGPPPRPPHEVALEALERLEASELLVRGEMKEYHIEASTIIRRYVEARFHVPALEMTTWETLDGLARVGAGEGFRSDLARFLDPCDQVKFAKVRPGRDAARELIRLGRALVEESMSRADAAVASAMASSADSDEAASAGESPPRVGSD